MNWKSARVGWAGLVVYVVAWDYLMAGCEGDSLTSGFRHVEQPHARALLAVAWGITTLHLFGVLPTRIDPYVFAGQRFGPRDLSRNKSRC